MSGQWHGGKGDRTRDEAEKGSYADNYPAIDWNRREREAEVARFRAGTGPEPVTAAIHRGYLGFAVVDAEEKA